MPAATADPRELPVIELERARLRELRLRPRTVRELLAAQDEAATLLATMYEIGGMAVVA